jgi:alpha-L-rhamnosidase
VTLLDLVPTPVRFEHRESGAGLGTGAPRLSWQLPAAPAGFTATGYELELTDLATGEVTTRRVDSAEQVLVPWPFAPLPSPARAAVRVRVAAGAELTA